MTPDEGRSEHALEVRVRYAETDRMGHAYYGAYMAWLEVGRVEYLRARGVTYRRLEEEGFLLPVREAHVEYLAPARYDDLLTVRTRIGEVGKSRAEFLTRITRGEDEIARARVTLACVDGRGRPVRVPDAVREALGGAS